MRYERITIGTFLKRPNRFIAHVEIEGKEEIVHVKNTGRCAELLVEGQTVYVQRTDKEDRKTKWDLIAVKKGERMVNMDSQITNYAVREWIEKGNLIPNITQLKQEVTFGSSRFDLYVETKEGRKIFIEVKGVTLEEEGVIRFPDAPSVRAVKHVEELIEATKAGYEAFVFFVVQMKDVRYFTPNIKTHEAFALSLQKAKKAGVSVVAYDCYVDQDTIEIESEVPVVLSYPTIYEKRMDIVEWFQKNKRDLPWRKRANAYHVWVSEIMLQQTRVEAVKPFYARFLEALPTISDLANAEEDLLLKLWEGLGYYNRVRNMQKAAQQIVNDYGGEFPRDYVEIKKLKGIGDYTAGAISSFAFHVPKPAVDGNVLRVLSRFLGLYGDIGKASVKTELSEVIGEVIPEEYASDFNQGLIEIGAIVCVPNGTPKCIECPLVSACVCKKEGLFDELPVKAKAKPRKLEDRTVLLFRDGDTLAIKKRPQEGLLAGLYEFPNILGHLSMDEVVSYSKSIGLMPIKVKKLVEAKHIFSHIEWHMIGYEIRVDELEKNCTENMLFISPEEVQKSYSIPSAFQAYRNFHTS